MDNRTSRIEKFCGRDPLFYIYDEPKAKNQSPIVTSQHSVAVLGLEKTQTPNKPSSVNEVQLQPALSPQQNVESVASFPVLEKTTESKAEQSVVASTISSQKQSYQQEAQKPSPVACVLKEESHQQPSKQSLQQRSADVLLNPHSQTQLNFTLSRFDFFVFVQQLSESNTNPLAKLKIVSRSKKKFCDKIVCGGLCFAMIFERSNVVKMLVRLQNDFAEMLQQRYKFCKKTNTLFGQTDWYSILVDFSFSSKSQVFDILSEAFRCASSFFGEDDSESVVAQKKALQQVENSKANALAEKTATTADSEYIVALAEREIALERLKYAPSVIGASLSRQGLLAFLRQSGEFSDAEILENEKQSHPAILKVKGKTFALIYEKTQFITKVLKETSLTLKVRLSDEFSSELTQSNPQICRIRYLKSSNWHNLPLDGSQKSFREVADVLLNAKEFVKGETK